MPRTIELYAFRFRDPHRQVDRARYPAELHEIKQRYAESEIIGEPQIRHVPDDPTTFEFRREPVPETRSQSQNGKLTDSSPRQIIGGLSQSGGRPCEP